MKSETFELIKSKLICTEYGQAAIRKINLNAALFDDLNFHPYISNKQATIIINFRTQHGVFKSVDELKNTDCFSTREFNKIKHYLHTN